MQKKRKISSPTVQPKAKAKAKAKPAPSTPSDLEYQQLFDTCVIAKHRIAEVDKVIDEKVLVNRGAYEDISQLVRTGGTAETPAAFGSVPLFRQPGSAFRALSGFQPNPVEEIALLPDKLFQRNNVFKLPDLSNYLFVKEQ